MEKHRGIILALAIATAIISTILPCPADEKNTNEQDEQSIWTEDERRERSGRRRWELTEEEINRIMEGFKKRNPKKAKELSELRKKDPEKFRSELERHAREEFGEIVRERIEKYREQRRAEFLKWFEENVPDQAKELARLKERSPDHYWKKYELIWRKYRHIFEENRRNPELASVLLEDVKLKDRRNELIQKIKTTKSRREREKLTAKLEEVIGLRYDVILRRKQMAYERLLKWLEELQNRIKESRADIRTYQDPQTKQGNIKQRTRELLENKKKFGWD